MQIVCDPHEEEAIQIYAERHNITFGEAFQRILDAMTKGLLELVNEDGEIEQIRGTTTRMELDSNQESKET